MLDLLVFDLPAPATKTLGVVGFWTVQYSLCGLGQGLDDGFGIEVQEVREQLPGDWLVRR